MPLIIQRINHSTKENKSATITSLTSNSNHTVADFRRVFNELSAIYVRLSHREAGRATVQLRSGQTRKWTNKIHTDIRKNGCDLEEGPLCTGSKALSFVQTLSQTTMENGCIKKERQKR